MSYADLWRFTLVNYNARPGCLSDAVQATSDEGGAIDWDGVSAHLSTGCQGAIQYVDDISKVVPSQPGVTETPVATGIDETPLPKSPDNSSDATPTPDHDGE